MCRISLQVEGQRSLTIAIRCEVDWANEVSNSSFPLPKIGPFPEPQTETLRIRMQYTGRTGLTQLRDVTKDPAFAPT